MDAISVTPAKVHKIKDEEIPRRSTMDIAGLKDFDSQSHLFPWRNFLKSLESAFNRRPELFVVILDLVVIPLTPLSFSAIL
ncbi:hypothetical protein M430DRAFT_16605 [Amorphotheca resinae ATCC 22711]|uniref:Uncharacterized protein n=1 Tax=Amorphotheca resinae ATCC 22711 TaxID=857342 RepID=A0A2T3BC36_AMORE|nr:hypothetical protein M430DRAFT_16605 [Amorphotheca resinae ATCC 22711]PSS25896.1 hypothetical protein M430DRAFT_16605 [Amorphotheca resinae ATCC 22711]